MSLLSARAAFLPLLAIAVGLVAELSSHACHNRRRSVSVAPVAAYQAAAREEPKKPAAADPIKVPDGHVVLFKLHAEGVQVYDCRPKKGNAKEFEWVLREPIATLLDGDKKVGSHGRGPAWKSESGGDASSVKAQVPPMATLLQNNAIPWLLLKVESNTGKGRFEKVSYIQRIDTVGGRAPAKCDESYLGTELRVPYKATYVFYGPKQ
jgi:hypothetical protein